MNGYDKISSTAKQDSAGNFPVMLHRMLTEIDSLSESDPAMNHLCGIVSWLDHGRAFKIHDKKRFINVIMKRWFVRIKHASWVRQLNSYGFKKMQEDGPDQGAVYHALFIREYPELAKGIQKVKRGKSAEGSQRTDRSATPPAVGATSSANSKTDIPHTKQAPTMKPNSLSRLLLGGGTRFPSPDAPMSWPSSFEKFGLAQDQTYCMSQKPAPSGIWQPLEGADIFLACPPPAMVSPQTSCILSSSSDLEPLPLDDLEHISVLGFDFSIAGFEF